jgi:hypothetical protein
MANFGYSTNNVHTIDKETDAPAAPVAPAPTGPYGGVPYLYTDPTYYLIHQ